MPPKSRRKKQLLNAREAKKFISSSSSAAKLRENIPKGLDTVTVDNIANYFCKARQYMFAYLEGFKPGKELENQVKKYKQVYKSHRRVGVND